MTEDEAKTKWCPFARASLATENVTTEAHNRLLNVVKGEMDFLTSPVYARCIGSACMAWRWSMSAQSPGLGGYCGLAGRPQ